MPQLRSVEDVMGAIRIVVRQEITRALHPALQDRLLAVSAAAGYLCVSKSRQTTVWDVPPFDRPPVFGKGSQDSKHNYRNIL